MRTLAMPKTAEPWSLTSLREKLIKIGARVVKPRTLRDLPDGRSRGAATDVRRHAGAERPAAGAARVGMRASETAAAAPRGEECLDASKVARFSASAQSIGSFDRILRPHCGITVGKHTQKSDPWRRNRRKLANVGLSQTQPIPTDRLDHPGV